MSTREEAADRSLLGKAVGSYTVTRAIARGGMGEVYEAVHPQIGRRVAVKVLGIDAVQDPLYVQRFFNEARAVNVIHHENIIEVIDLAALSDKRPYLVMEYLDGQSLAARLAEQPVSSLAEVGQVMLPCLDALEAAHREGILHRDLKPDNIFLVERRGEIVPKILDFGIAKLAQGSSTLTAAGLVLGTPRYMAPEQARGLSLDPATDLYSMGIILYEMCTGELPFQADAYAELLVMHIMNEPPRPRTIRPDLPAAVEAVILKALRKEVPHRWRTANDMGEALRAALLAGGVAAEDLPAPKRRTGRLAPSSPTTVGAVLETGDHVRRSPTGRVTSGEGAATIAERPDQTNPATPSSQVARARSDRTMRAAAAEVLTPAPRRGGSRTPLLVGLGVTLLVAAGAGGFFFVGGIGDDSASGGGDGDAPTARSLDPEADPGPSDTAAPRTTTGAVLGKPATAGAVGPASAPLTAPATAAIASGTDSAVAVATARPPKGAKGTSGRKGKKKRGGGGGTATAGADDDIIETETTVPDEPATTAPDGPVSPDEFDATAGKKKPK